MRKLAAIALLLASAALAIGVPELGTRKFELGVDYRCKPIRAARGFPNLFRHGRLSIDLRASEPGVGEDEKLSYLTNRSNMGTVTSLRATANIENESKFGAIELLSAALVGRGSFNVFSVTPDTTAQFFSAKPIPSALSISGSRRSSKQVVVLRLGENRIGHRSTLQRYTCETRRTSTCVESSGAICGKFTQVGFTP